MNEVTASNAALDLVWGAEAIGKVLGRSTRSAFDILEKGELPARKVGGRWVVSRSKLEEFFSDVRM